MKTKICCKCGIEKDISEFGKRKDRPIGYTSRCLEYRNKQNKEYYKNNHQKELDRGNKYKSENYENILKKNKKWREDNPKYQSNYSQNNREKINNRKRRYDKEKRISDPLYKLRKNSRTRLIEFLKTKNIRKNSKTFDIIGCSPNDLKEYIEKQFTEGMSWNNYGFYGWHIDHRIPLESGKTEEEIYKLCHFTNLQPMWWEENLKKGKKIIYPYFEYHLDDDRHIIQN
jgi:hypothetical protein